MWYTKNRKQHLFNICLENPFKTWWKARKYFKRPKLKVIIHRVRKYNGYPYATWKHLGKILDINVHDVWWKDKWNSPRHERNPLIYICLFRRIALSVLFRVDYYDEFGVKKDGSMEYWEYLINWLYYQEKKSLICYSTWTHGSQLYYRTKYGKAEDGSEDVREPLPCVTPCVALSLNKKGIKELKLEIINERRGGDHTES